MTSLEKFNLLIEMETKECKVKVTTVRGDVYYCIVECPAEEEKDWAYHFISPDYPTKYFILSCNFIEKIEEVREDEWARHLAQIKRNADEAAKEKF